MTCEEPCDTLESSNALLDPGFAGPHKYPRPDYSMTFRCLAEACEENCCNGWAIPIDADTLDTYRHHTVLKPFADALVVIETRVGSTARMAQMPLTHAGTCAFLNDAKLCGIHAHFGPALLSKACATYPREVVWQSGEAEAALNLSCPEAARLTLLNANLLGAGPWQVFGPRRYAHMARLECLASGYDPVLALRELALLLLSDPTYPLWQRMHLAGDLARRLESEAAGGDPVRWAQAHPATAAELIGDVSDAAAFHTHVLPVPVRGPGMALRFAAELLRKRLAEPPVSANFAAMVKAFQSGLGSGPGETALREDAEVESVFCEAERKYVRPLLERHPYLLENFLVNHVFKYAYPFGRKRNGCAAEGPVELHLALVGQLALLQTVLVGVARHFREGFRAKHVLEVVQALTKGIEHRPASMAHIVTLMREMDMEAPPGEAELLSMDFLIHR